MSQRAYSSVGRRLRSLSLRLTAAVHPYYLHTPRGDAEPAPGWYWQPNSATHPQYLGYNGFDAAYKLQTLLITRNAAAGAAAAELRAEVAA